MNLGGFFTEISIGMKTDEQNRVMAQIKQVTDAAEAAKMAVPKSFDVSTRSLGDILKSFGSNFKKLVGGIRGELNGTTKQFDKDGNEINTSLSKMGLNSQSVMQNLVTAIVEVCKQLNQMVEAWYAVDKVVDNLNTKLESTAEVHEYITDSANELRISYSTIADGVSDLVRTGNALFKTTEEATDFLTLADKQFKASGASESQIASLNNALVESFRTGRVSASAFNSIMTESPETISLLAESLNITEQQVKALGTQGKLTAKQLYEAFEESADEIEESFSNVRVTISEAMTELKNTLGTFVTNLNDSLGITDLIAQALEDILAILQPIFSLITTAMSTIGNFITSITETVRPIVDAVFDFFNVFMDMFNQIAAAIQNIWNSVIGPIISIVSELVGKVMSFVNKIMPVVQKFCDIIVSLVDMLAGSIMDAVGKVFDAVVKVLEPIMNMIDDILEMLDPLIEVIMEVLDVVMQLIGTLMNCGVFDVIADVLVSIMDAIMPIVETLVNVLEPILQVIINVLTAIFSALEPIFNILTPIFDVINQIINSGIMNALQPVLKIIEVISGLISALFGDFDSLKETFKSIGDWFSNLWDKIKGFFDKIKEAFNKVKEFLQNMFKSIANFFIKIVNGIITGFEAFCNFFVKAINGFTQGLSKIWTWMGIPAIPEIKEVSFKRIAYLAEGGYVGPNSPQLAVIGDNPTEGEIVAPESKLRENMEIAFRACLDNASPQAKMAAISPFGGSYDNRVINNTTQIYNTFNGSSDIQKTTSEAARTMEDQIIGRIANALAGER